MSEHDLFRVDAQPRLLRVILTGPRGHALRTSGLLALAELLEEEAQAASRPLLLAAEGRSFCTGLDLDAATAMERPALRELMRAFHRALRALLLHPGGSVAAIGGHALAGGAILALACDARVVAEGAGRLGIHGIRLGIAYPDVAVEIVRKRFSRGHAEQILYAGETLSAEEAPRLGWAEELCAPEELQAVAQARLARLRAGASVFARNKERALADVAGRLALMDSDGEERFLDVWFSSETQALLSKRSN